MAGTPQATTAAEDRAGVGQAAEADIDDCTATTGAAGRKRKASGTVPARTAGDRAVIDQAAGGKNHTAAARIAGVAEPDAEAPDTARDLPLVQDVAT
jgi:hypothetical protein